ncbi:MAG: META domain-containing protein, partial [Anaerolineae bacterium]|nr:META domain-containing protein [Anaerolineae bacterium]
NQGQCTTLRWDVQNIQAVWVYPQGANFQDWPAAGQGSRQVCPTVTTTYEMRVQLTNGSTEFRQLTVTVNQVNPLANSSWALTAMNVTGALVPGTSVTAFFGSGNALSGFGGCNNYNGSYFVSGASLSIGSITSSMMICDTAVSQQETLYLSLLQAAATFEIQGATLIVRNAGGQEILRFSRIG